MTRVQDQTSPPVDSRLAEFSATLRPLFEKYGIRRAIVFGSFARGETSRRSDLDLLLVWDTSKRFLDRYGGILREIVEQVHGHDVDLLIYTPQELEQMVERPFLARALGEGVVIYESGQESLSS